MSPCETSKIDDILEHPIEAFEYFRSKGVEKVVCEQKHMGSRAVIIVCKDMYVAKTRFSIKEDLAEILSQYELKESSLNQYTDAYRQYCWSVNSIEDYKIAPFHILATEGVTYSNRSNVWHMDTIRKYMTETNPMIMATPYLTVDVNNEDSVKGGIAWWENLTESGGEGMVVKPFDFFVQKGNELLQPAVKCRGKEYLRIIYGPEYTLRNNLQRLKKRSLSKKRSLALREFSLGMESLERFVKNEPLYRVHECVFGVLALESESVDPRL